MKTFTYTAQDEVATDRLGAALAVALPDSTVVALHGTLGAGKTRLVQAVARAEGIADGRVVSPTFVLIQEYTEGRRPVYHFDVYRLKDVDELEQLGAEEYFYGTGLVFVEWAERIDEALPPERVDIEIEITGEHERSFTITGRGNLHARAVEKCRQYLTQ